MNALTRIKKVKKGKLLGIIFTALAILTGTGLLLTSNLNPLFDTTEKFKVFKERSNDNQDIKFNDKIGKYEIKTKGFVATLPSSDEKELEVKNPKEESLKVNLTNARLENSEEIEGSVLYKDAYEKTDVKYESINNGIKESIILKEPGHPDEFIFSIDLSKYDYVKTKSGRIKVYQKGHKENDLYLIFDIPAPYMLDANDEKSHDIEVEIVKNQILIRPNKNWLKNAEYPVIVDPTIAINVLNVHSNPLEGKYWEVDFTTVGTDDLYIKPADQATIDDMEFASLKCGEKNIRPKILKDDVIFVRNWSCEEVATVSHLDKKTGNHHLIFEFAGQTADAYNAALTWDGGAGTTSWSDAENWSTDTIPGADDDVTIDDDVTVNINPEILVSEEPRAQWRMNDNEATTTVVDTMDNLTGTAARNTDGMAATGKINGALEFNGTSDYISIPQTTLSRNGATLTGFFYINDFTPSDDRADAVMFVKNGGASTAQFIGFREGAMYFETDENNVGGGTIESTAITSSTWFHFALVFESNTATMYINGAEEGSVSMEGNNLTISEIGTTMSGSSYQSGYPSWFDGRMDDIRLYNNAIDEVTISNIYNSGNGTEDTTFNTTLRGPITINSLTLGNSGGTTSPTLNFNYDPLDTSESPLTIDEGNLTVNGNANITHSANTDSLDYNIDIDVQMGNAIIVGSGTINVNGKGYTQGNGPGTGTSGDHNDGAGGGAYGGNGGKGETGRSGGEAYGSIDTPENLGSGGGTVDCCTSGGTGGGYLKLNVAGTLTVNGIVTANGNNGGASSDRAAGGGAGGGILLTIGTFEGTGTIRANGGNGGDHTDNAVGGGGSGGRISIKGYTADNFSGSLIAQGGVGPNYNEQYWHGQEGGAGTIYKEASGATNGDLIIDNGSISDNIDRDLVASTPLSDTYTFENLTIKNYGEAEITGSVTATNLNLTNTGHILNESGATLSYTNLNWTTGGIITDNGGTFDIVSGGGDLTIPESTKLIANTARTFTNITVDGTLTHSYNSTTLAYQINYTTTGDFTLGSTGSINVNGRGYIQDQGPQPGTQGDQHDGAGGGGHGGKGGEGESGRDGGNIYGNIEAPNTLGSGGGSTDYIHSYGGDGGGLVRLDVGGTANILGTIYANGTNGTSSGDRAAGGGAGGGIYISADIFDGTGTITANGGNGAYHDNNANGGGGAGGRIAIDSYSSYDFSGTMIAQGGGSSNYDNHIYGSAEDGGAGTIFKKSSTDTNGHLIIDNGSVSGSVEEPDMATTPFADTYIYDSLTIKNYANVDITGTVTTTDLTIEDNGHINNQSTATINYTNLTWITGADITDNGGTFDIVSGEGDLTIPSTTTLIANTTRNFNSVTVNGTLTHSNNGSTLAYQINYTTTGDLTVGNTGSINVNGRGYTKGNGPGSGTNGDQDDGAGGGGYGGKGGEGETGRNGGDTYGNIETPNDLGSGGGNTDHSYAYGGDGGGLIRLNVGGTADILGTIYANGTNGRANSERAAGGGSGGGIYISADVFDGTGTITANGGNGAYHDNDANGGGGAGGRIAIDGYSSYDFSGTMIAQGGGSSNYDNHIYGSAEDGGAGTIFKKSSTDTDGHLLIDNGSVSGSVEEPDMATTPFADTYTYDSLTIKNYANVNVTGTITTTDLTIEDNGHINNQATATINYSSLSWTSGTISDNGGTFDIVSGEGNLTVPQNGKLIANTTRNFNSAIINGTLTHTNNSSTFNYSLDLSTTTNFTLASTGSINVNGRGYTKGNGPGSGTNGDQDDGAGGGGYGGDGGHGESGRSGGSTYGNIETPDEPGSGGGNTDHSYAYGGDGGGLIRLDIGGTADIQGTIYANGTNGTRNSERSAGGGSGGGIYISADVFDGTGTITANGGNGAYHDNDANGGGGAGGRIAIDGYSSYDFTGTISAQGGDGPDYGNINIYGWAQEGAAGTIFKKGTADSGGHLTIDNGTITGDNERGDIALNTLSETYTYDSVTIKNYARTILEGTFDLTTINIEDNGFLDLKSTATITYTNFNWQSGGTLVDNGGTFDIVSGGGTLTIPIDTTLVSNTPRNYSAVTVNGTLTHSKNSDTFTNSVDFTVSGDVSISGSGSINLNARGFSSSNGNEPGTDGVYRQGGGGGGYGGTGGAGGGNNGTATRPGGGTYPEGEDITPTLPGSGGGNGNGGNYPGGYGGGYLKIDTTGTLEILGLITVNGGNGDANCNDYAAGGGSGGGIYLRARDIEGTGTIRANGGNGYNCAYSEGGGGGGGRIAILYNGSYNFLGNTYVNGGSGVERAENGSEGTIYIAETNTLPVASAPYEIEQATDGSGNVVFKATISDENGEDTKLRVEYSDDNGTTWYDPYLVSVSVSSGETSINNTELYQIGESDRIDTSGGEIELTITWSTKSASNAGGSLDGTDQDDIMLRVKPHDGISEGRTQTGDAFSLDNLAPSGLTDLTITTLTDSSITVTWNTITEEEFDHFEIWYDANQTNVENRDSENALEWDENDDTDLNSIGTTTTTITGIEADINYYWKLWAVDAYGNEGTTTTLLQTIADLGQFNPDCLVEKEVGEGIEGTSGCFKAQVADTDASDNLYLEVEVKEIGTSFDGTETVISSPAVAYSGIPVSVEVTVSDFTIGNTYHWRVRSRDDAGTTSTWITFGDNTEGETDFTAVVPSPSTVISTYISDTEISITWNDPSSFEDGFILERSANDEAYTQIADLPADTITYTDNPTNNPGSHPQADSKYIYRVKSTYTTFESTAKVADDPTYTTPAAPTGLSIQQTGMGTITLTWTDNSGYEEYFEVQRKIGTDSFETITTSISPESETHNDTNVKEETTYQYRILAIRTTPESLSSAYSESNTVSVTIGGGKGIHITSTGRLIVQNDFNKEINIWDKIQDNSSEQIGEDVVYDESNPVNGPVFSAETTINDIYVEEGGSLVDGRSDIIYVATNLGVIAIHEKGIDPSRGGVKYYNNEYITDLMIGNIKAMWTLHEAETNTSVNDTSANNNSLIASTNTTNLSDSGVRGKGWTLSGEYAYSLDNDNLDFGATDNFSITTWFKHGTISTNPEYLIAKHQSGVAGGYKIWMENDGNICFGIDDDGTWDPDDSACTENTSYDDNEWHQITVVKTSTSKIELFVDGDEVAQVTSLETTGTLENNANFYLGIDSDGISNSWNGSIDEISITEEALTDSQIKILYEIGNRAARNHQDERITGVSGTDIYQKLLGAGTNSETVNKVTTLGGDAAGQYLYVGTNDITGNTGGLSILGVMSDTVVDLYTENNTTKVDSNSNPYTGNDIVAVSIIGIPTPDYRGTDKASGVGGIIAVLSDNDSATRVWIEGQSYSLARTLAALTSNTGSSGGTYINITNTQNPYFTNSDIGMENVFSIDTKGNIVHNYYGVDRDTTAIKFSDPVLTSGTTMQIIGSEITSGKLLDLDANSLTTGNGLSLISSSESLAGSLADIQVTGTAATGNAMNLASSATGEGNKVLNIAQTGGTTGTDYGAYISNTGEGDTNVGLFASATEATNNYAAIFENGYVGIGTTTPTSLLTISGLESSTGTQLVVDASGNVYKDSSSRRYKENIEDFSANPRQMLGLQPVEFYYKDTGVHSFGYLAEETDELGLTNLVMYDNEGQPDSLRYDKLSIYLVEGYKEHEKEIELIQQLFGINETAENTESSSSSNLAGLTESITTMSQIYNDFKQFVSSVGLSVNEETETLIAENNFEVLGETTLNEATITGNLYAGLLKIDSLQNTINTSGSSCYNETTGETNVETCEIQTLYLQKNSTGNIDLFDGAIIFKPNGEIIAKSILANTYKAKENKNIGRVVIPAGEKEIFVQTPKITRHSNILITRHRPIPVGITKIEDNKGFYIGTEKTLLEDLTIDWMLVETTK